jgi:hypothetical protein
MTRLWHSIRAVDIVAGFAQNAFIAGYTRAFAMKALWLIPVFAVAIEASNGLFAPQLKALPRAARDIRCAEGSARHL